MRLVLEREAEPRFCAHCGTELFRKRFNGRLEDLSVFHRRRFCSLSCANSKDRPLTKHGYSWRARKLLKQNCEACDTTRQLHAHHVDQDKANNTPENIQTLCKFCHDFWHSTARRLGLLIAGRMPHLYSVGKLDTQESLTA